MFPILDHNVPGSNSTVCIIPPYYVESSSWMYGLSLLVLHFSLLKKTKKQKTNKQKTIIIKPWLRQQTPYNTISDHGLLFATPPAIFIHINRLWNGIVQILEHTVLDKMLFSNPKVLIFFLFLYKNTCCGYLLEAPQWGTSNEALLKF